MSSSAAGLTVPASRAPLTRESSASSMPIDPPEHRPKQHPDDADNLPHSYVEPTFGRADLPEVANPSDQSADTAAGGVGAGHGDDDDDGKTDEQRKMERDQERTGAPRIGQGSAAMQSGYSTATSSTASESDDFDWDDTDSANSEDNDSDVPTSKELAATGGIGGGRKKNIRARRGRAIYLLCMRLARPVRIGILGLLGTAIALVPFIVAITAFKRSPAYGQVVTWSVWVAIIYSTSCATFLLLDAVPTLIMRLAIAVYGRAPEVFKTQVELLTATLFYIKLVLCVAWAWISLGGCLALSYAHAERPEYFVWVNRTIASLFGTAVVLLAEKILLQIVAISFHKTAYKDRLEKNTLGLRALDRLHESKYVVERSRRERATQSGTWGNGPGGHSRVSTPLWGKSFHFGSSRPPSPGANNALGGGHSSRKPSKDGLGEYFTPGTGKSAEAATAAGTTTTTTTTTYPPSQGASQHHHHHRPHLHHHHHSKSGDAADGQSHHHHHHHHHKHSEADGNQKSERQDRKAARRAKIRQQVSEVITMATMKDSKLYARSRRLGSQQSARKLAKKLFNNLNAASYASHGGNSAFPPEKRSFLTADDFIPYFKTEAEAREVFNLFDADRNGDLSKREMREAVQRIYKERRTLSIALKDMSSALGKLDLVLQCIGFCIVVFIWLLIFNRDQTIQNLVPASTFILGFSFIFSNSAKTVFESMVFIFVTHAYDVGDLVCIDDTWMFVKEFGFISTVFRTTTNQEIVAPNSLLSSSKYIHNARRSGSQWETVNVQCGFETSLADIDEFRRRLRAWVKENDREWGGGLDVNYNALDNMNSLELTIAFEHKSNWQDWGTRWSRRTKLMRQIKTVAEELRMPAVIERVHGIARPRQGDVRRRGGAGAGASPSPLTPSPLSARAPPPLQIPSAPTGRIPFF
ncbi:hypothetical protein OC842_004441 [Tilletia horrida]|uniref:EF-hand domain-containing protein n=1 Tax=Tilletia horrida TaxID=155126 RepID=A0AAN6GB26_9BASI|nr:hypothetical protein OC842_004441 [Tilletia horrida]